jgi:hypothetical protein
MLRMLKWGRDERLKDMLGKILADLKDNLDDSLISDWVMAIGVYAMSVNKTITANDFEEKVSSIWPVQIEPGSLADRLKQEAHKEGHKEGRKEGHDEGLEEHAITTVLMLQNLLNQNQYDSESLSLLDFEKLSAIIDDLQLQLRSRIK